MNRKPRWYRWGLMTILFAGCMPEVSAAEQVTPRPDEHLEGVLHSLRARFEVAAASACEKRGSPGHCTLTDLSRAALLADIAQYTATFQVGPGQFDVIAITRVVQERQAGIPVQTVAPVLLIHGSSQRFFDQFVKKSALPEDPGLAVWLAERGVDVWGIDLRFALVPTTTTDFGFMSGWDFQTDVSDTMLATRFARHARRLTGQRFDQVHLVGFSNGASVAYAAANAEAVLSELDRDVGTLIPIETVYKLSATLEAERRLTCDLEAAQSRVIAQGNYAISNLGSIRAGQLAKDNPEGASPFRAGFTNRQFALLQACATSLLPFPFHRVACTLDESGRPRDARFTRMPVVFELLAADPACRPRGGSAWRRRVRRARRGGNSSTL